MSELHDIGNGVMMPPMSMHTPRDWGRMLVAAQKERIAAMQKRIDDLESAMQQDINKTGGNYRLEEALKND